MTTATLRIAALCVLCLVPVLLAGASMVGPPVADRDGKHAAEKTIRLQYLEIVTPSVNETCEALAKTHGVTFGEPIPEFGNARTGKLQSGGRIGVRAPMRATEKPVVRPYLLVDDIEAAVKAAEAAGAVVAMPPMAIPGQGKFSIYILGGIEHGLWQL